MTRIGKQELTTKLTAAAKASQNGLANLIQRGRRRKTSANRRPECTRPVSLGHWCKTASQMFQALWTPCQREKGTHSTNGPPAADDELVRMTRGCPCLDGPLRQRTPRQCSTLCRARQTRRRCALQRQMFLHRADQVSGPQCAQA